MRLSWTPERLARAKKAVEESSSYPDAAARLSKEWKAKVSADSISQRLRNAGIVSPSISLPPPPKEAPESLAWQRYRPRSNSLPKQPAPAKSVSATAEHWLIVPDVHHPYPDRLAWGCLLGIAKELKPQRGIILGDFLDMESLSRHPKSKPDLARLASEFYAGNLALDALQSASPNTRWSFLEGNHEDRGRKFANEYGQLDGILNVSEQLFITPRADGYRRGASVELRGMEYVSLYDQPIVHPFAQFLHGDGFNAQHFAAQIAQEHPGRISFLGHRHTFQQAVAKNGAIAQCCGFLGDSRAAVFDYATKRGAKRTGWQHGCVVLEVIGSAVSWLTVPFVNGRAVLSGKSITARAA